MWPAVESVSEAQYGGDQTIRNTAALKRETRNFYASVEGFNVRNIQINMNIKTIQITSNSVYWSSKLTQLAERCFGCIPVLADLDRQRFHLLFEHSTGGNR